MSGTMITKENSLIYIALSILCSRDSNYLAPELLFILGVNELDTLIKVFGGQTIKVPDANTFKIDLLTAMFAYHYIVGGKGKKWFWNHYNISKDERSDILGRFKNWFRTVNEGDIGVIKEVS